MGNFRAISTVTCIGLCGFADAQAELAAKKDELARAEAELARAHKHVADVESQLAEVLRHREAHAAADLERAEAAEAEAAHQRAMLRASQDQVGPCAPRDNKQIQDTQKMFVKYFLTDSRNAVTN